KYQRDNNYNSKQQYAYNTGGFNRHLQHLLIVKKAGMWDNPATSFNYLEPVGEAPQKHCLALK
ncbi:MAG: hypothetical protein PHS52_06130, partial [Desulfotomaculaceae bacterium]|nr:hypothetical protein [Desulfotomaculaceae bacterium]